MKTLLILVDGMRPDALTDIAEAQEMKERSSYALDAQTVFPSVTLPCHMSLFHSVDPGRHGTTDNVYAPQVRPVEGICEVLNRYDKKCAVFFDWEQLRDLTRPGSLAHSFFISKEAGRYETADPIVTEEAIKYMAERNPDFVFVYLGWPDDAGHTYGWMSEEYMRSVRGSWKRIEKLMNAVSDEWSVIVTADHGGHERMHGTTEPEDMTIPIFFYGKDFKGGKALEGVSIKDIAPTILKLQGVAKAPEEWEGKSLA